MLFKTVFSTLSILEIASASPLDVEARQTACNNVQIFIARGSNEPYPGRQGALATAICSGVTSCGYTDIGYPATFDNYCNSVSIGVANGTSLITAYAQRCPSAKLVLTGYSQGAQVVGDILGGGGGNLGSCTQSTTSGLNPSTSPANKIVAATFFGDVRHVANQVYNTASGSSGNGIYPRTAAQLASLNVYSSKLRSWCLAGDPVCAGGTDGNAHTSYFDVFTNEAAAWVKTKL